jgi:transcriptional regulator with PAS, ATPase and Fis domain
VEKLIRKINYNLGLNISGIDRNVLNLFHRHNWPGNVRELEHTLERAANIVLSGPLTLDCFESLKSRVQAAVTNNEADHTLGMAKRNAEVEKIVEALRESQGNVSQTCKILKVSRSVLYEKIRRYDIKINRISQI